MGMSWQTTEQKTFIDGYLPSYNEHLAAGTTKADFWPDFVVEWFKSWPLPEPTPEAIQKEGNLEKAKSAGRNKRIGVSTICVLIASAWTHHTTAAEACVQSGRR